MNTGIVIPCYNERDRLPVDSFKRYLSKNDRNILFLFVDDGSTDGTYSLLETLRDYSSRYVRLLRLEHNAGKGEAIRQGMRELFKNPIDAVGYWDADLATPLSAIAEFQDVLTVRPNIQWVTGARVALLGRTISRKNIRHYFGRAFATAVSVMLDTPVYDTQCGAKLFRSDHMLKKIFADKFLTRWIFDVELIARLIVYSGDPHLPAQVIYEYPLQEWTDVGGSKLTAMAFIKAGYDLTRIWRYLSTKKSDKA